MFAAAGVGGAGPGLASGLAIGFFLVTTLFTNATFENRPLALFYVNGSCSLVQFAVLGATIGGWRKKTK